MADDGLWRVGGSLVVLGFVVVPFVRVVESICGRYGSRWSTVRVAVAAPRPQASGRWPQVAGLTLDAVAHSPFGVIHMVLADAVECTLVAVVPLVEALRWLCSLGRYMHWLAMHGTSRA